VDGRADRGRRGGREIAQRHEVHPNQASELRRSASAEQPILAAIDSIATHCDAY